MTFLSFFGVFVCLLINIIFYISNANVNLIYLYKKFIFFFEIICNAEKDKIEKK